jgi:osmotically-inducible protein OsmY
VARELAWDTRVSPTEIGLKVKGSIVTLMGTVDSWAKLRAAEEAAHRVRGVLDVANELVVKPAGSGHRTDTEIAAAVRRALEWDVTVPDQQIQSTVSQGRVTLKGTVSHWSQRADAERAIERLAGVRRVVNQIDVQPREQFDVDEARLAVEKVLGRHAGREPPRVDLRAANGTVNVSGLVHTLEQKAAVLGAVRATRGVCDVADDLRVQPDA